MQKKTNDNRNRAYLLSAMTMGMAIFDEANPGALDKPKGPPPNVKPHHRSMSGGGKRARRRAKARARSIV